MATTSEDDEQVCRVGSGRSWTYRGGRRFLAVENIGDAVEDEICEDEGE